MHWNNYLSIAVFILTILLALIVYIKNPRRKSNIYFAIFSVLLGFWIITNYFTDISTDIIYILLWSRLALAGPILLAPFFILFSISFPQEKYQISRTQIALLFIPTVILLLFVPTKFNIESIVSIPFNQPPEVRAGVLYYPFALYLLTYMGYAFWVLYKKAKIATPLEKLQIKFVFLGVISALILSIISNVLLLLVGISQASSIGPLFSVIIVITTAYAIIKHRLFDIRIIIKRTFVYSLLLIFVLAAYAVIVFGLTALIGADGSARLTRQQFIPNIIAAIAIAIGFDPIRRWLEKVADKFLYVGQYNPDEVMRKLGLSLASSVNLTEALHSMMEALIEAMRLSFSICFILKNRQSEAKVSRIEAIGISKEKMTEEFSDKLIAYFKTLSEPIIREELERDIEEQKEMEEAIEGKISHFMQKVNAAVAFPVFIKEKLIGVMMMSEKKSGDVFTDQDLRLLNIASLQTASAIEKERLYEEDQMKSEFVSIASHELLTPTAAIEGYLSMILDEKMAKIDSTAQKYLTKVYNSSRRLSRLVKDLLNVSRIEAGRLKVTPKKFDLIKLIQGVMEELLPRIQEKGLKINMTPKNQMIEVWADPERIHQVIYNFIGNAIKYSITGTIKIEVKNLNNFVKTSISDSGIGISAKDLPHLFEKFFRVQATQTTDIQGTGLGLYISKNIIELSGGKVEVDSRQGKGSTFSFTLPKETKNSKASTSLENNQPNQTRIKDNINPSQAETP